MKTREQEVKDRLLLLRGELLRIPADFDDEHIFSYQLQHGAWESISRNKLNKQIAIAERELVFWTNEAYNP